MQADLQGWWVKAKAMKSSAADLLPTVEGAAFYALLCSMPVLALLAMGLNAVLPGFDPVTGERAGAWLAPIVIGTPIAIYLGLMLGYLYVHGVLVLNESIPPFIGRQVRTMSDRVSAAARRAGVGTLVEEVRARAVVLVLIAFIPLLGIALLMDRYRGLRIAPRRERALLR